MYKLTDVLKVVIAHITDNRLDIELDLADVG
jgi:hypothetical protein